MRLSILCSTKGMKVKGNNIQFLSRMHFTAKNASGEINWKVSAAVYRIEVKF